MNRNNISPLHYILLIAITAVVKSCTKGLNAISAIALLAVLIVALIAFINFMRNMKSLSKPFTGLWALLIGISVVSFIVDFASPEEYDPLMDFYTGDLLNDEDNFEEYEESSAATGSALSTFGTLLNIAYYIVLAIISFKLFKNYRGRLRTLGVSMIAAPIIMYGGLYIFAGYKLLQNPYYTADKTVFICTVSLCLIVMCIPYMIMIDINRNFKDSIPEFEKDTIIVPFSQSIRKHTSNKPVTTPAMNRGSEILQGQAPSNAVEVVEVVDATRKESY